MYRADDKTVNYIYCQYPKLTMKSISDDMIGLLRKSIGNCIVNLASM